MSTPTPIPPTTMNLPVVVAIPAQQLKIDMGGDAGGIITVTVPFQNVTATATIPLSELASALSMYLMTAEPVGTAAPSTPAAPASGS